MKHYDIIFVFCNVAGIVGLIPSADRPHCQTLLWLGNPPFAGQNEPTRQGCFSALPSGHHDQVI
ncbi:hypothetical protein CRM93_07365 [Acetobacter fabarum]|uniref:Uncharacterized protein n=1 Tax=Acetobacter fabarum TaxID=483199 RepID=A0A269Y1Y8_9PROT|nr:hypothetical protein B8X00_02510 [Acetobacter fabarum]PEN27078.1 hypothetical protein CRM93_07365 [Acetobacter fabarum]